MTGKSIFIWKVEACLGGDVSKIAASVKAAGFETVILHEVSTAVWRSSARLNLAIALKTAGIRVYGGAAVYGTNPILEGQQAAQICNDLNLEGFVFDAEKAFDGIANPDTAAVKLLLAFRAAAPGKKAGWCWWAFWHQQGHPGTIYHPKNILWAAMAKGYGDADFGIPMMYWSWGDTPANAVAYLNESWAQWRELVPDKPICPAGRAYIGDGGTAKPDAMAAFEMAARQLGAQGVTWWSMQHALDEIHLPGVWEALAKLEPFVQPAPEPEPEPEPHPLTLEEKVIDLERRVSILEGKAGLKVYLPVIDNSSS